MPAIRPETITTRRPVKNYQVNSLINLSYAALRQALTSSGHIDPNVDGVLTIRLDPLPTRRASTAIAELCQHLTATKTRYLGTDLGADLITRYEIKSAP
ncbi:MAG: hypothetical protein L0H63_09825 [Nitrococcus sp.]|nr:hypothetical protein [Nitrococcus sp.]